MLPPHRLIALALYFSVAYGRPASPSGENNPDDGPPIKGGQLLKDPYNPHDLVSSEIPGRRPHLPYSARPSDFVGDQREWISAQNIEHIVSQILTYDGDPISAIDRWTRCMDDHPSVVPMPVSYYLLEAVLWPFMEQHVAAEKECIKKVNQKIQTEATAKEKSTYFAGQDTAALHNPYHLESAKTPFRPPRLPHDRLPAGDQRDLRTYNADENKKEIISHLKQYDGQRRSSWDMFIACMKSETKLPDFLIPVKRLVVTRYLTEQLDMFEMLHMRGLEGTCKFRINLQIEEEAARRKKEAYLPVRTYAPLLPPPQQAKQAQQAQQEHTPRNEFSSASIATTWAHRAGHFLKTQSHRLELGARPLQKLVRGAHMMKMPTAPEVPAWEFDLAH
ncbi:MAG: hypothetical protein M1826_006518 [Phylliscum demangeonii]|nr:MAG: hypothetical protein M1826_006518 [Phylliscum demangeonii]